MRFLASSCGASSRGIRLFRKHGTKSVVWEYFRAEVDEGGRIHEETVSLPLCRTFGKKFSAKGSNTTNLLAHLRDNHPILRTYAS